MASITFEEVVADEPGVPVVGLPIGVAVILGCVKLEERS